MASTTISNKNNCQSLSKNFDNWKKCPIYYEKFTINFNSLVPE